MKNYLLLLSLLPIFCVGQTLVEVPTGRDDTTMNILVDTSPSSAKTALLIIGGTEGAEGRIMIKNSDTKGVWQYLYRNRDLFEQAGIRLIATGCPTDEWSNAGMCADSYRKSEKYANDFKNVIEHLKKEYQIEKFYIFGHSSGGISTRWLSVNLPSEFAGVVNSSIMNGTAKNLASSTVGFDMKRIKAPVLNIAHESDLCPSTPYFIVKNYSLNNLVTVRGGGTSGSICGGTNHHSFEDRQRGVSKAIVKWITTGDVQEYVDSDE